MQEERRSLETHEVGDVNRGLEHARLELRGLALEHGEQSELYIAAASAFADLQQSVSLRFAEIRREIDALNAENARYALVMATADGMRKELIESYREMATKPARV